jgi:hypothetical protein
LGVDKYPDNRLYFAMNRPAVGKRAVKKPDHCGCKASENRFMPAFFFYPQTD